MKIIKTVARRCHIFRLKCTKFDSAGAPPRPAWEAYSAPQTSYLVLRGPTSKEERKGWIGRGEGKGRKDRGRE